MSWAKVSKINSNFKKPLNEQARELTYSGAYIFEKSTTFTPDKTGWYKVIVVGSGGDGDRSGYNGYDYLATGGSGGVAISTLHLLSSEIYHIEVTSNLSSFNNTMIATAGTDGDARKSAGTGGTANGGDFNYNGLNGETGEVYETHIGSVSGASVGVYIPELMKETSLTVSLFGGDMDERIYTTIFSSKSILGYGASATVSNGNDGDNSVGGGGGCVLIIPLEFEE